MTSIYHLHTKKMAHDMSMKQKNFFSVNFINIDIFLSGYRINTLQQKQTQCELYAYWVI